MAEHEDDGKWVLATRRHRGQHLVCGAARVRTAVRQTLEIGRQFGAETAAENRHDDVALGRRGNLRLEGRVGLIELGLPPDCFEPGNAGEFAIETLDDAVDPTTLVADVGRRRDKDAKVFHRSVLKLMTAYKDSARKACEHAAP